MSRTISRTLAAMFALSLWLGLAGPADALPWLSVKGNQIVDEAGVPVTLRGVSVLSPEHNSECHGCGSKPTAEVIRMTASGGWRANVLRLPITTHYVSDPVQSLERFIKPNVDAAIAQGQYVIIDLHLVSDYGGSRGVSQQYVDAFWKVVSKAYADNPNVIFEVFNEPINPDNWATWKSFIQPVISNIRAQAPRNLILVGGPQWSTRVNAAAASPLSGGNLVYVYHIYPNQGPATAANLDPRFGDAALKIPVMITEFGWNPKSKYSSSVTAGATSGWGRPFRAYLDARPHVSWVGWIFDTYWKPQYFDSKWTPLGGEYQGQFMQSWLSETNGQAAASTLNGVNVEWTVEDTGR